MKDKNQLTIAKEYIMSTIDGGETNLKIIYDKVVDDLGIPRPTVRRAKAELLVSLENYIKVLD